MKLHLQSAVLAQPPGQESSHRPDGWALPCHATCSAPTPPGWRCPPGAAGQRGCRRLGARGSPSCPPSRLTPAHPKACWERCTPVPGDRCQIKPSPRCRRLQSGCSSQAPLVRGPAGRRQPGLGVMPPPSPQRPKPGGPCTARVICEAQTRPRVRRWRAEATWAARGARGRWAPQPAVNGVRALCDHVRLLHRCSDAFASSGCLRARTIPFGPLAAIPPHLRCPCPCPWLCPNFAIPASAPPHPLQARSAMPSAP